MPYVMLGGGGVEILHLCCCNQSFSCQRILRYFLVISILPFNASFVFASAKEVSYVCVCVVGSLVIVLLQIFS